MICTGTLRTQAYLDCELDSTAAEEAERHIEGCADCQALSTDVAALSYAIRQQATKQCAPDALRLRITGALDGETTPRVAPLRATRRSFWFGAASGAGISALAAGLAILTILPPSAGTLAQAVTDAHTRALMSGTTIEVVSSNHHTVKPWFAGRVAVSPPVADFPEEGFTLAGARVDNIADSRAAVVAYRHGKHEIDLFVWADKGLRLPGEGTRHGYHSIFWKSGDLDFAAVSDTESPELQKFVRLVRNEPE
jgi:anti-sigma factor RsiW